MIQTIGVAGLGFVGDAIQYSFEQHGIRVIAYDKFRDGGIGQVVDLLVADAVFLALPTPFSDASQSFDLSAVDDVCQFLHDNRYDKLVILKSTVEPETTVKLSSRYSGLKIVHNPEFLTARTARDDFHGQGHIVLGRGPNVSDEEIEHLGKFYRYYYPNAQISHCQSTESELMKLFCNSFYASKIQILNEYYLLCEALGLDYDRVRDLMLRNNWINTMHTDVPGQDGQLSYGGACFPKDTRALLHYMRGKTEFYQVLKSVIEENQQIRN